MRADESAERPPAWEPLLAGEGFDRREPPSQSALFHIRIAFLSPAQAISRMRTIFVNFLAASLSVVSLIAGQLDIAVIQYPEEKGSAELQNALAKIALFELTNSDRTRTTQPYLKGGYVLFAQRLPATLGASFSTATRLKNAGAEVKAHLTAGAIAVSVSLIHGVNAGWRTFARQVYTGSGPLPTGPPRLLSVRTASGRSPNTVKGQTTMQSFHQTTLLIAQYAP